MPYKDKNKRRQASAAWSKANRKQINAIVRRKRAELRSEINRIKERGCADCGKKYAYYVMDFDHRDPEVKTLGVSALLKESSRAMVMDEIKKCDVVCANCHRERTHQRSLAV